MTKLNDLVKTMLIKEEVMCMGDIWHNETILKTFEDVKSNKFNLGVAQFVKENLENSSHKWYWYTINKTQLKKLNAIMKAKTKETLQKRVYDFSNLITRGRYSHIFNRKLIASWIKFCNENKLEHGLVKVNRVKELENYLNNYLIREV